MLRVVQILLTIAILLAPMHLLAMKGMGHGDDMGSKTDMKMGSMVMLGSEEVEGIKASAHLMDVAEEMSKHGMKMTHHIMVRFVNLADSEAVETGQVAVKVEDPAGNVSEAYKLIGMDGHFGVDLTLDQKGLYHFKIGTKLPDGKNRTFHFHAEL